MIPQRCSWSGSWLIHIFGTWLKTSVVLLARGMLVSVLPRYDYIAFTDDDVVVDRRWLTALHRGFSLGADVDCVTGMVATGQLQSRSQRYFDRRVSWARNVNRTIFRLQDPPPDMPLFPFQFGAYGTGANFSARRSALFELGGFDEALGVGSPTAGGEDIDFFIRVVLANRALVYLPDAVVWHKHRADDEGLKVQLENYGRGLGAVLTKLACERRARRLMATRLVRGIRYRATDGPRRKRQRGTGRYLGLGASSSEEYSGDRRAAPGSAQRSRSASQRRRQPLVYGQHVINSVVRFQRAGVNTSRRLLVQRLAGSSGVWYSRLSACDLWRNGTCVVCRQRRWRTTHEIRVRRYSGNPW